MAMSMRGAVLSVLVAMVLLGQSNGAPPSVHEGAMARARGSVVLVRAEWGQTQVRLGSGVVLAPGIVATNAHVVKDAKVIWIIKDGRPFEAMPWREAPDRDLVLLRVAGLPIPPALPAPPEALRLGQRVQALAYPAGFGVRAHPGQIKALWKYRDSFLIQADALTQPGSSGGGLFTEDGLLVGITTFVLTVGEQLNFSVPVGWVQALMEASGPLASAGSALVGNDLLKDFTDRVAEDPANQDNWEAIAELWVQKSPRDPAAWYALGTALDRRLQSFTETTSELPEAAQRRRIMDAYEQALALDPNYIQALNNLGVAYDTLNRFQDARLVYERAVRIKPTYGLGWLNLANTLANARSFQGAIDAYTRGLALLPDEPQAWARLAYCEANLKRWTPAAEHLTIALRYRPFRTEWWSDLHRYSLGAGNRSGAEAALVRLRSLAPALAEERERQGKAGPGIR
jgi:cytochrome c-type biogenesis protein CcmH/NrfG